jgi:predicted Zn-dependent protease
MKANRKRNICILTAGAVSGLLLAGCATVPVTGRHELNLVSSDQEMQLGLTSFDQLKKNTPVDKDPTHNEQVERVGKRIAAVADKDLPNAKWEFVVFDSKEANAFCLPGGKVGVYSGILPITQTDAGLATVLGHEIGHAVAHHGASRMSEAMVLQGLGDLSGAAVGSSRYAQYQSLFISAYGVGSQLEGLRYSRKEESEADHIGLVYMARAGFDPREAVTFWERFANYSSKQGGNSTPTLLRDHPVDSVRIEQLKQWLPEAQAEYSKSGSH